MLKLGFHYHIPALQTTKGILMPGYQGRFIDSLAAHCNRITCFLHHPAVGEAANLDYTIQSRNVSLVDIGPHASVPRRTFQSRRFTAPLHEQRDELDVMLLRGPSPLLPAMARAAGSTPLALLLVGDYLAGVDDLPQPRWRKEAIRLWSRWNQSRQLAAAKRALTFVNSHKLYEELHPLVPHLVETRTTTLSQSDFCEREDTCQSRPIRLLYTGRMDRAKGLFEMVEALARLVKEDQDVVLDLVGMLESGDQIMDELQQAADKLGVSKRVIYHGYKPIGPELFEYYRKADIYVIASKSSFEGFPRTIWEAMAHSLPVVATRVGSIPAYVEGICKLVEPRNIEDLAYGLDYVINNSNERRMMILIGRKLALENTLEKISKDMVKKINNWARNSI